MIIRALGGSMFNINFELSAFILGAIFYFYLLTRYSTSRVKKAFLAFMLSEEITLLTDIVSTVTNSYSDLISLPLNVLINTLCIISNAVSCYFLLNFYLSFEKKNGFSSGMKIAGISLLILQIIMLTLNSFTGWIFTFVSGRMVRGPLHALAFIVPLSFFFLALITYFVLIAGRRIKSSALAILFFFWLLSLFGSIVQYCFFPHILLRSYFTLYAEILCIFTLVSPNYSELTKKREELSKLQKNLESRIQFETKKIRERENMHENLSVQITEALAGAIDTADSDRMGHSKNVAAFSRAIAEQLGLGENETALIYRAAILHDIGVLGVDENVIHKSGKLSAEEFGKMKRHCEIGARILGKFSGLPEIAAAARSHHERFDGLGYPDALKGDEIPLAARIIAVADAYDAMTHERSYRKVFTQEEVRKEFERCSGSQFDPEIVSAFFNVLDKAS